jgi:hypothetical protein
VRGSALPAVLCRTVPTQLEEVMPRSNGPWGKHRRYDDAGQLPPWPQVFITDGHIVRELDDTEPDEDNIYATEVIA